MSRLGPELPDFPWDRLIPIRERATAHADGICDLSVGTPIDPVPDIIQSALRDASNAPGYPTTHGTIELRESIARWLDRRLGVPNVDVASILPAIGTKELIAGLPTALGVTAGQKVVIPELAYPTYEVGALIAGAIPIRADSLTQLGPSSPKLLWLNSPSNPTGKVLGIEHLRKVVQWAQQRGVIVASDECYLELGWGGTAPLSILDPAVCGDDRTGLLSIHSLSKRSNLAGYRFGFVTGDPNLVKGLLQFRKHAGFMVPSRVQAAATAAYDVDQHVIVQRGRYQGRRETLVAAFSEAGYRIDESEAGLYLWVTGDEPCMTTVEALADLGILVAPGDFYGPRGARHVRVALTASDDRVKTAAQRLLATP